MLAKDRKGRFVSAAGVVVALQAFAAGADLTGLSPPAARRNSARGTFLPCRFLSAIRR
jgi:hypothetical protein